MKFAARACGIRTPHYLFAPDLAAAERLRFPLAVKHANSCYSSIGMTRVSRVTTPDELRSEVRRSIDRFGGALIEEFIDGHAMGGTRQQGAVSHRNDNC